MSGLEQARATLARFAERHGIHDFSLDETGALALGLDDILYVFQYNDALGTLVLMAGIGKVPLEARSMVFGQLLSANLFWGETGGCTFAFESSEELVVMQYSLDANTLEPAVFEQAFDGLRAVAGEWKDRMRSWIEAEIDGQGTADFIDSL